MSSHSVTYPLFCLLLTFVTSVLSLKPSQYCFYGCNSACYQVKFEGTTDPCLNPLFYKSNFYCAAVYCSDAEIAAGLEYVNSSVICEGLLPSFDSVVGGVDLDNVRRISYADAPSTYEKPLTESFIADPAFFEIGYDTTVAFYTAYNTGYDFSYGFFAFWGIVVFIGIAYKVILTWRSRKLSKPTRFSSIWLWIRRSLILPATFNQHCQEPIGWATIPPRLESLLLVVYTLLNFVACFPAYHTFLPNTYYPTTKLQLTRYISDRTGILSIANVPIFWIFATRNDPLLWLTGWSFATYNRFHRWVARISTVQAIVHSIGWTVYEFYYGGKEAYYAAWAARYWWTGGIATVIMSLALGFAAYNFRRDCYDLFLVTHFLLALVFLITLYYHVIIFDGEFNPFIWPCVAIWSLDRLIRIGRVVYTSIVPRLLKGVKATATYDKQSEMIRLDVTDFLSNKKIVPGKFYYLYTPASFRGYESHPMTLCSWKRGVQFSPEESESGSTETAKDDTTIQRTTSDMLMVDSGEICHSFLIRPYEGFTGRLRKQLDSSLESKSSCQMTLLLEGPYGNTIDLSSFSNILVIAGGSGITAAISHTHHLLQSESADIQIVWAVPQKHLVDDVATHELAAVLAHPKVSMTVYLTGAAVVADDAMVPHAPYDVHLGRPDVLEAMQHARSKCSRNLAVVSCGTPLLSDACRRAVVDLLKQDGPEVGYFDETTTW